MALINCRECGGKVSDAAKTCPSCGIENPSLNTIELIGGGFSKVIGVVLLIIGILVWAIIPLGAAFGVPLIIIGSVMYFAPQFGFGLLIFFALYSQLDDLSRLASTFNSFVISEFFNIKTLMLAMGALIVVVYEYEKASKVDPLGFLNKTPLEVLKINSNENFNALSNRINGLVEQLNVGISLVDASSQIIVLSENATLLWSGCVFILKCENKGLISIEVHSKLDNYVKYWCGKPLRKLVNVIFSLQI